MTREDVLRRLVADVASGRAVTAFGSVVECHACRRFIVTENGLDNHVAWHRKESRKYPAEFWATTRFIHHMIVLPANPDDRTVTGVTFGRICNFLADAGLSPPGNSGLVALVAWTLEFIGAHRRLLREAGFNIRNRQPRQDFYLMDEAAFVFIFELVKAGMDTAEILDVVQNVKTTRSTEAA